MRDREKLYSGILALTALILLLILTSSTASAAQSNQSNLTITQITTSGSAYGPSIDDDRIVYTDYRNGKFQICMYNLSISEETVIISSKVSVFAPAIYGDRVVRTGSPYDITDYNIYMYDFSTKKETQITTSGTAFYPIIYGDTVVWQDRQWVDEYSEIDDIYNCDPNSSCPVIEFKN